LAFVGAFDGRLIRLNAASTAYLRTFDSRSAALAMLNRVCREVIAPPSASVADKPDRAPASRHRQRLGLTETSARQ